jgi:hypothetical protein
MREIVKAEPAVRALRDVDGGGQGSSPTSRTRSRSSSASTASARNRDGRHDDATEVGEGGVISAYRARTRSSTCAVGPHVPSTGKLGHFKLHAGVRRVLARRREGPDAAAHLRHRVGVEAGARRPPPPLEEAAKRDHRKLATELDLLSFPERARRGAGGVAPQGRDRPQADGGLLRTRHEHGGYEFVYTPHIANGKPVRDVRAPRVVRRRHVPADGDGQRHVLHEADELPDALPDLPQSSAQLPRAAAAAVRARQRVPLREAGTLHGLMRIRGIHPGRQPHLLHQGADGRRDRRLLDFVLGAARLRLRRLHLELPPVDQGPGQVRRQRRGVGRGHRGAAPGARRHGLELRRRRGRRRLLRPEDRHRRPGRDRAVVAAVDHPGRLPAARAVRSRVRRRRQRADTVRS